MKPYNELEQQYFLQAMGITRWIRRGIAASTPPEGGRDATQASEVAPKVTEATGTDWRVLEEQVRSCTRCGLCEGRTQTVFGVGNQQADLMIVGEAPGFHEDKQGKPFVGRAGQLLDAMLSAFNFSREGNTTESVYIANVLKCRPPENRDPKPDEILQCNDYLLAQLRLVQPKLVVALGRFAAHTLLNTTTSLAQLRGKIHSYRNNELEIPLIVSYHPAYLLRNPKDKAKSFHDWQLIRTRFYEMITS